MKRLLFLVLILLFSVRSRAETFSGKIENLSSYDKGAMACVTEQSYNSEFKQIADAVNQDSTNNDSATKLLKFFQDDKHGSCYKVRNDGNFTIKLPDSGAQYVLVVALSTSRHVFWDYVAYHGEFPEAKIFTAPKF